MMRQLLIIIPKKKSGKLTKLLDSEGVKRFFKTVSGNSVEFSVMLTELQSKDLVSKIKNELGIHAGKPSSEGYIAISEVELVAPPVFDKELLIELDQLIINDAKEFIRPDRNFLLFIVSAAILSSIGLLLDSIMLLVGAMIIGPLMSSLMAVSYGLAIWDKTIILKGLRTELTAISLIVIASFFTNLFFNNPSLELEVFLASVSGHLLVITIASLLLGVIGAASFATGEFEIQAGIAISLSLIPPLTNFVTLLHNGLFNLSLLALSSFLINVLGMQLAAIITFLLIKRQELRVRH